MAGMRSTEAKQHHDLMGTKARQQEDNVTTLTATIKKCIDPFSDQCDEVINILTKAIMPEKIQQDIARRNEIGQAMYAAFVTDRITGNSINLWSPMKKCTLLTWSSSAVTAKVKDGDKIIELREDRALFARLLVVSKARQIDLKYNLGKYEFSVVPRALFVPDGSLHHMENKSELMKILESLPKDNSIQEAKVMDSTSDSLLGKDSSSSTVPDVNISLLRHRCLGSDGKSILQVPDTGTRVLDNTRPFLRSSIVSF